LRFLTQRNRVQEITKAYIPPPDWVQPWWLARQRDPDSGAYYPSASGVKNAVGRSWTLIGNLDSDYRVAVDRRGLIAARPGSWSLDWWVRASEQWVFPSTQAGTRQRIVDGSPVIETTLRVAGGDVIHRVYMAKVEAESVVFEIENQTTGPVALALAIRPYDLQGGGTIKSIELDEDLVTVDGVASVYFSRNPGELVVGREGADCAALLSDKLTGSTGVTCLKGRANAAAVFPLVHGATFRGVLPRQSISNKRVIDRLPSAQQVASGWGQHAVSACRAVIPAGRFADAFDAGRQSLLLAGTGNDLNPAPFGPEISAEDDCDTLIAIAEAGYDSMVQNVLIGRAQHQNQLGSVRLRNKDFTAETLIAMERAFALSADEALMYALSDLATDGARWLIAQPDTAGAIRGLEAALALLLVLKADSAAFELNKIIDKLLDEHPQQNDEIEQPSVTIEDDRSLGINLLRTSKAAFNNVASAPKLALRQLETVLDYASPTWSWPTFAHPKLRTGTAGTGHDLRVSAWLVRTIRRMLVDDFDSEAKLLRLATVWPDSWIGHGVEVHGMPTRNGKVSWAVRWHGDRPALLWEVEDGSEDLVIMSPGLDPAFRGSGPRGEALLTFDNPIETKNDLDPAAQVTFVNPANDSFT